MLAKKSARTVPAVLLGALVWLGGGQSVGRAGPARAAAPDAAGEPAAASSEIRCVGEVCNLGACVTQRVLGDPAFTARSARIVPTRVDGQAHGFKLFAIRPGSWLAQLGLRSGDEVISLNGLALHTPEDALAAYAQLREATALTLVIERAGKTSSRQLHLDRHPLKPDECPPLAPATATTPATNSAPVEQPAESPQAVLRSLAPDISCKATQCFLRNGVFDRILANTNLIVRSARLVPLIKDGQPQGFKLFAIRPGTLLALLGLKNGDALRSVNGRRLASPQEALAAYSALSTTSELHVALDRAGAPVTLTYVIQR